MLSPVLRKNLPLHLQALQLWAGEVAQVARALLVLSEEAAREVVALQVALRSLLEPVWMKKKKRKSSPYQYQDHYQ